MPTDYECAYYADQAYKHEGGEALPGWEKSDYDYPASRTGSTSAGDDHRWNLGMAVYKKEDKDGKFDLVISIKGTDRKSEGFIYDLLADYSLSQSQVHPNQEYVDQKVKDLVSNSLSFVQLLLAQSENTHVKLLGTVAPVLIRNLDLIGDLNKFFNDRHALQDLFTKPEKLLDLFKVENDEQRVTDYADALKIFEDETGFKAKLRKIFQVQYGDNCRSITLVGHSMGAYIAEACSCRIKKLFPGVNIKAVVFESPGAAPILKDVPQYTLSSYDHIKTYLAAPNFINMCHPHVGEVRRLFFPYTDDSDGYTGRHVAKCIGASLGKIGFWGASAAGAAATAGASVEAEAGIIAAIAGFGFGSTLALGVVSDTGESFRQHEISNFVSALKHPGKVFYSVMGQWPCAGPSFADKLIQYLVPFSSSGLGGWNMFDENGMYERQYQGMPGYVVAKNFGVFPDWAKIDKPDVDYKQRSVSPIRFM